MADGISGDFSEVMKLAADLGKVADNAGSFINAAVQKTSVRVKQQARKSVGGGAWAPAGAAINYDVTADGTQIQSEIGYDEPGGGGELGNLREFGAPGRNLAPSSDLVNALHANEADFEKGLSKALEDAEKKAGL